MTLHYLMCYNSDCEKVACVSRRELEWRVAGLEEQLADTGAIRDAHLKLNKTLLESNTNFQAENKALKRDWNEQANYWVTDRLKIDRQVRELVAALELVYKAGSHHKTCTIRSCSDYCAMPVAIQALASVGKLK